MTLRKALLTATIIALPASVMAQPIDGLYVSGAAGVNFLTNTKVSKGSGSAHLVAPKVGPAAEVSVGYGYGNGLRAELELLGIGNSLKGKGVSAGAQQVTYGLMANGLYDIDVGLPVTPYVGVGVGYVFVQENSANINGTSLKGSALGSFAAQGIVGAAYSVTPQLAVTADYRLLDKVQDRTYSGYKIGSELNNSFMVGLRYAFGAAPAAAPAPAPAAAVAPAPAPARSYLVFFDWDKADLTARAQQIIAEAAKNSTAVKATRIDVAGHADKSGTPAYNQTLSLKRANNVAAELVRLGVPKSEIAISAYGDTKPLVPTAAGVREPQNRRVEIVLH